MCIYIIKIHTYNYVVYLPDWGFTVVQDIDIDITIDIDIDIITITDTDTDPEADADTDISR